MLLLPQSAPVCLYLSNTEAVAQAATYSEELRRLLRAESGIPWMKIAILCGVLVLASTLSLFKGSKNRTLRSILCTQYRHTARDGR